MLRQDLVQHRLLTHLPYSSADPVDVVGIVPHTVVLHILQQIDLAAGKTLAIREYPAQPGPGAIRQVHEEGIRITVAVPEKGKRRLPGIRRQSVRFDIAGGEGLQNDKAGHVQTIEPAERNQLVLRVCLPITAVHGSEQSPQGIHLPFPYRGQNHEGGLRDHVQGSGVCISFGIDGATQPESRRVSAKSRMRIFPHHTLPR